VYWPRSRSAVSCPLRRRQRNVGWVSRVETSLFALKETRSVLPPNVVQFLSPHELKLGHRHARSDRRCHYHLRNADAKGHFDVKAGSITDSTNPTISGPTIAFAECEVNGVSTKTRSGRTGCSQWLAERSETLDDGLDGESTDAKDPTKGPTVFPSAGTGCETGRVRETARESQSTQRSHENARLTN
jgi:hypothetical protein